MRHAQVASIAIAMITFARTATAQAPASPVQQSMRQLMMAEEQYYSDHGTYTTDLSALGLMWKGDKKEPQVWLRVYHAGGAGWIGDSWFAESRLRSRAGHGQGMGTADVVIAGQPSTMEHRRNT